jgi:hypothetical protein
MVHKMILGHWYGGSPPDSCRPFYRGFLTWPVHIVPNDCKRFISVSLVMRFSLAAVMSV